MVYNRSGTIQLNQKGGDIMAWRLYKKYRTLRVWKRDCGCRAEQYIYRQFILILPCRQHAYSEPRQLLNNQQDSGNGEKDRYKKHYR